MDNYKPITWFKGDNYEDFCLLQNGDRILKCIVEKDPVYETFNLKAGYGYKVTPEYVENFTKNDRSWSVSDIENIMKMEYHFPKFTFVESFDSLKQVQDFVDNIYKERLEEEDWKNSLSQPYDELSKLSGKYLAEFPSLEALALHILKTTTFLSQIEGNFE